jgi:SOS response regulatory protein OraA/RecX
LFEQALSNKGVSEADTDKALKLVFEDGDSDEQESKVGMSKISMDQLLIQASKQWLRGQDVPKDTRKSRLIRWLQYRGFNWDVVNFVLKKLESQHIS